MKHVSFKEYEDAKKEIIGGVQYKEESKLEGSVIRKTYATKENGVFYEVNDGGRVEFWSDKHPESRIYDENEQAAKPADASVTAEQVPGYGELLSDKIRTTTGPFTPRRRRDSLCRTTRQSLPLPLPCLRQSQKCGGAGTADGPAAEETRTA